MVQNMATLTGMTGDLSLNLLSYTDMLLCFSMGNGEWFPTRPNTDIYVRNILVIQVRVLQK